MLNFLQNKLVIYIDKLFTNIQINLINKALTEIKMKTLNYLFAYYYKPEFMLKIGRYMATKISATIKPKPIITKGSISSRINLDR